jgi:hypothetical protein
MSHSTSFNYNFLAKKKKEKRKKKEKECYWVGLATLDYMGWCVWGGLTTTPIILIFIKKNFHVVLLGDIFMISHKN